MLLPSGRNQGEDGWRGLRWALRELSTCLPRLLLPDRNQGPVLKSPPSKPETELISITGMERLTGPIPTLLFLTLLLRS